MFEFSNFSFLLSKWQLKPVLVLLNVPLRQGLDQNQLSLAGSHTVLALFRLTLHIISKILIYTAGAVLQTPSSQIHSLGDPFVQISSKHLHTQAV